MDEKKKKVKKTANTSSQEKKEKPVTVHITNHNTFQKGVGAFVTNLNHLTIVMDSEGNMKMDASQVPTMPHTQVDVEQSLEKEEQDEEPLTDADMAAACEQTLAECLWWADASWGTAYQIFLQKGYNGGIDQFVRDVKKWPFKKSFKKKCNKYSVGNPARKGTITWPFEKWREKGVAERQIILGKRLLEILKDKGKKVNMGI